MFGWWKKSEGFEWREYVRTTILVRRQKRRERIEDAKQAAVAGLKEAGRAGAAQLKDAGKAGAAGLKKAGKAGAVAGASGLSRLSAASLRGLARLGPLSLTVLSAVGRAPGRLGAVVRPALLPCGRALARSNLRGPILLMGIVGAAGATARLYTNGLDTEAMIAGAVGMAGLLLGALPTLLGLDASRPAWLEAVTDRLPRMRVSPAIGGGLIVASVAAAAGLFLWKLAEPAGRGSLLGNLPLASKPIEGRAIVLGADSMKVGNIIVRLSGMEAPEAEQRCPAAGKKTIRCSEAATEGLTKIVRGKLVSCNLSGSDEAGRSLATCKAEGADVAGALIRQGLVFAQQGLLARYASAESEARTAKLGVWKGDVQRPSEWRAKRWEEAKRSAPDGCPIKGAVGADGKVYVLPWSREYERVKVRTGKGERWFCSEQEARAAGWRLAERS